MVLNIKISKALPTRAIDYAVAKNLLKEPIKRNLFSDKNPTDEMKEIASKFGKWKTHEERKSFSLIISPNPKDNPTEEQLLEVSEAILDRYFPTIQGFLVLHKDKGRDAKKTKPVLHSHFYGSIIDPITGKNIHLSNRDVKEIREWADSYANEHFGWSLFERGNRGRNKYGKLMMQKMIQSGRGSWMRNLVENVEEAYNGALSFSDFERRLQHRGVTMEKDAGSGQYRFCITTNGKNIKVNATTISKQLDIKSLSNKFTDFVKEEPNGSKGQQSWNEKKIKMGTGFDSRRNSPTTGSGACSGAGSVGSNGRKINYGCIICTKDKDICHNCTEFKKGRGGQSHGSRVR